MKRNQDELNKKAASLKIDVNEVPGGDQNVH